MAEFDNQVAVVTGGAQGLGFAITQLLIERGARVAMLDVDAQRLESSAKLLESTNRALAVTADVTDESAVENACKQVTGEFGKVDILINNAGIYPHATLSEITVAEWDKVFDVNVKSAFLAMRAFMHGMMERKYGRMVSVVTVDSYIAKPTMPHYASSKAALGNLIKTFAHELAPHGILVNGVSPGAIATERAKSQSWLAKRIKQIPVGHAAEPEDIAEVVLFLASSRNRFIAGETIVASGGALMV